MSKSKIDLVNEDLQAESKREQSTWLRWKDKFKNIKVYVVLSTIYNNNLGMFWFALTGLLTSIERRYSFNSETMGRLLMAAEFGPLIILLFISHFANRYNMPRITAGLYVTFAAAVAMMTLPHYILKSDTKVNNATTQLLCIETNITSTDDDVDETMKSNTAAFGILYAALFMVGTAGAPAHTLQFSYLESNTKQTSSALYIALAGIGFSTAPILGLFLSAWATSLYVDLSDTHLVDSDPAWVGAWWLALIIIAACVLLPTPLLCCLPRTMKDNINEKDIAMKAGEMVNGMSDSKDIKYVQDSKSQANETRKKVYSVKGFFLSMKRLLLNPAYMVLTIGYVFWAFAGWGFGSYAPKYYQVVFGLTAWESSITTGLTAGVGSAFGRIAAAVSAAYFKLSLRRGFVISVFGTLIVASLTGSRLFLGCENTNLRGQPADGGNFIMDLSCAAGCACSDIPYTPVCDSGVTYFSPCHAGCTNSTDSLAIEQLTYTACNCTDTGEASRGICETDCDMFIPYAATMVVTYAVSAFISPYLIVFTMRCVDPVDKTLAYGFASFLITIAGFLPASTLYGAVIDTACVVWDDVGAGITGSCWQYDLESIRYRLQGLTTGCWTIQLCCYIVVYLLARKKFEYWEKRSRNDAIMAEKYDISPDA